MNANHVFAGIPVRDYDAAVAWYERFFGRAPDLIPNDIEACWKLSEGGWIYIVVDAPRAGTATVTILVDDVDAWVDDADDSIPGMRRAEVSDADGNRIQVGQQVS
jgi:catechol 2,3-dioxygenase-like lactoylglutathione lyase family enzyme